MKLFYLLFIWMFLTKDLHGTNVTVDDFTFNVEPGESWANLKFMKLKDKTPDNILDYLETKLSINTAEHPEHSKKFLLIDNIKDNPYQSNSETLYDNFYDLQTRVNGVIGFNPTFLMLKSPIIQGNTLYSTGIIHSMKGYFIIIRKISYDDNLKPTSLVEYSVIKIAYDEDCSAVYYYYALENKQIMLPVFPDLAVGGEAIVLQPTNFGYDMVEYTTKLDENYKYVRVTQIFEGAKRQEKLEYHRLMEELEKSMIEQYQQYSNVIEIPSVLINPSTEDVERQLKEWKQRMEEWEKKIKPTDTYPNNYDLTSDHGMFDPNAEYDDNTMNEKIYKHMNSKEKYKNYGNYNNNAYNAYEDNLNYTLDQNQHDGGNMFEKYKYNYDNGDYDMNYENMFANYYGDYDKNYYNNNVNNNNYPQYDQFGNQVNNNYDTPMSIEDFVKNYYNN